MTQQPLSIGKIRGLMGTSTPGGVFNVLAFDHRQALVKMMRAGGAPAEYGDIVDLKSSFVKILSPYVSAVLLDPVFGAAQVISNGSLPGSTGLLLAVEETGYTGSPTARVSSLLEGWSVAKSRRMGATAIKLLVYYHPKAGAFTEKQEGLVAEVIEDCRREDLPLFLEIMTYSPDEQNDRSSAAFCATLPDVLAETARRMGKLGPEVLKIEFPVDARYDLDEKHWETACRAISAEAPCPWTVLSAGADFDLFCRQVEVACQSGASGFIAGRSVWKDGVCQTPEQRSGWLKEVAIPRFQRLSAIAQQSARPWMEFFPTQRKEDLQGWYTRYAE